MIIVSQNKNNIVNFENINLIGFSPDGTIKARLGIDDNVVLGRYKNTKRAKEVLQEIVMLFKDEEIFHIRKSTLNNLDELAEPKYILKPVSRQKVFEMPED